MSALTREEIRRAALAVGWRWEHHAVGPRAVEVDLRDRHAVRTVHRFSPASGRERWQADALALLEAAVAAAYEDLYFILEIGPEGPVLCAYYQGAQVYKDDDPIPAAAVRAVNAWAESRGRKAT